MFSQTILFTKNHRQITKIVIGRLFKIDNVKPVFPDNCAEFVYGLVHVG